MIKLSNKFGWFKKAQYKKIMVRKKPKKSRKTKQVTSNKACNIGSLEI